MVRLESLSRPGQNGNMPQRKSHAAPFSSATRDAGFTLLEVLIALVVLSIGLLGLAALQSTGLRSTHGANLVSQSSILAYDMADRIRANPQVVASYVGYETDCPEPAPALGANPDTAALAAFDLAQWSCSIEGLLPAGRGLINGVTADGITRYTITVEWRDLLVEDGADPLTYVLTVDI